MSIFEFRSYSLYLQVLFQVLQERQVGGLSCFCHLAVLCSVFSYLAILLCFLYQVVCVDDLIPCVENVPLYARARGGKHASLHLFFCPFLILSASLLLMCLLCAKHRPIGSLILLSQRTPGRCYSRKRLPSFTVVTLRCIRDTMWSH